MTTSAEKIADEKVPADKPAAAGVSDKRKALGRGLESLLGGPRPVPGMSAPAPGPNSIVVDQISAVAAPRTSTGNVIEIPLEKIDRNPYQTRHIEPVFWDGED